MTRSDSNAQALAHAIKNSPAVVHSGRYVYLKLGALPSSRDYFVLSQDADEITAVVEERTLPQFDPLEKHGWFSLVEFRVNEPFQTVGFIAAVTQAIAEADENVLIVSTFSKDYILVESESIEKAVFVLESLGCTVTRAK